MLYGGLFMIVVKPYGPVGGTIFLYHPSNCKLYFLHAFCRWDLHHYFLLEVGGRIAHECTAAEADIAVILHFIGDHA